jgi:CubicO group peptidase (beta-lactamase class C family)
MMIKRINLGLIALFAVSVLTYAAAAQSEVVRRQVDATVAKRMSETGTPGMAVAVISKGIVVHSKGYGLANVELGVPVTRDSVFNLASITKTFTALAVLKLAEQGRLSIDDPISKYFDRLPDTWRLITVRQLINNTSGIRSFSSLTEPPCNAGADPRQYKRGDVINEVTCYPLEFAPGERWKYGDTGFYLAGMLIERLTGMKYEAYLESNVLEPIGMKNTRLINYDEVIPNRVSGYNLRNGQLSNAPRMEFDEFSNGGLMSSLADMIRFEQAFLTNRVLNRSSIDSMLANVKINKGEPVVQYGLGIGLTPYKGERRFGHTGGGGFGFGTAFTHFPDQKVTVIVLANADQEDIGTFANSIAEIFFTRNSSKESNK